MTYREYQNRISALLVDDRMNHWIPTWINEVRRRICLEEKFSFLLHKNEVSLSAVATLPMCAFDFDDGDTPPEFCGFHHSIIYDDANPTTEDRKLSRIDTHLFNREYAEIPTSAAVPRYYKVEGKNFTINVNPSSVTTQKFYINYYAFPIALSDDTDEEYIDQHYSEAVIAGVCFKGARMMRDGSMIAMWDQEYSRWIQIMRAQETGQSLSDVPLRTLYQATPLPIVGEQQT